jgi:hypothetical protein
MEDVMPTAITGLPLSAPGGYVTPTAISLVDGDGGARPVSGSEPLPVAPLAGTASTAETAWPYVPVLGRAIVLTLAGSWTGRVTVLRSIDGGTSRLPLTVGGQPWATFTANANEAVAEESVSGATYYLQLAPSTGTISYRVQQ